MVLKQKFAQTDQAAFTVCCSTVQTMIGLVLSFTCGWNYKSREQCRDGYIFLAQLGIRLPLQICFEANNKCSFKRNKATEKSVHIKQKVCMYMCVCMFRIEMTADQRSGPNFAHIPAKRRQRFYGNFYPKLFTGLMIMSYWFFTQFAQKSLRTCLLGLSKTLNTNMTTILHKNTDLPIFSVFHHFYPRSIKKCPRGFSSTLNTSMTTILLQNNLLILSIFR